MAQKIDAQEMQQREDDVRLDAALQIIKDAAWRLEESSEGRRTLYDVIGCLVEDLVREGACPACIQETIAAVFEANGVDASDHLDEAGGSVLH